MSPFDELYKIISPRKRLIASFLVDHDIHFDTEKNLWYWGHNHGLSKSLVMCMSDCLFDLLLPVYNLTFEDVHLLDGIGNTELHELKLVKNMTE